MLSRDLDGGVFCYAGLDKWFPLTPISRDDEVQGEILVEMSLENFGEVHMSSFHRQSIGVSSIKSSY